MSRVTDALNKARGLATSADSFDEHNHPWGDDLRVDSFEPPPLVGRDRSPRPASAISGIDVATPRAPHLEPGQETLRSRRSALPEAHQHLAALVERVFLPVSGEPTRCVAFSAVGADVRSSAVTAGSAAMLAAQSEATVCLLDANFRAPSLHKHFGLPDAPGLADALLSGRPLDDAAARVDRNLWLVPAGRRDDRPSFASDSARLRMAQLIARFDYVLVDMESVSAAGDAAGLAPLVGGVILVVAAESTRRESARRSAEIFQSYGAAVIGAVLTNRRFPIPDALYRRL